MESRIFIAAEESTGGSGGGGPEDQPGFVRVALRSQGLLTLALGMAMGLAFMVFFGLVRELGAPTGAVADFVAEINPNLWLSFVAGFVGGTILAAVYNLLVVRRLNLFGLESSAD